MRRFFTSWLDVLLLFIPVTVALEVLKADPLFVFVTSALAIIPLAGLLGRATEHLTTHVGVGVGSLLNASLGNAAELIIALAALREGLHDVVKASLTGSILGNILLVLGASMIAGGMKYERQKFNQTAAGMGSSLLLLAAVGLIISALFHFTAADRGVKIERELSLEIALVLFLIYGLSLTFSLRTHRHLFAGDTHDAHDIGEKPWNYRMSLSVLTVVTILIGVMKWSPTALQPWSLWCLRRNPPKHVLLRQGFGGHPLRIPPRLHPPSVAGYCGGRAAVASCVGG